ncbi:dynein regulatory complex subunit 2-like [Cloeon dipterum]|uniref:dynein regulatory complex subunit 2-like n=1 Tax=Cloeon dipterum TaxID=197152 RepID=UPI00322032F8
MEEIQTLQLRLQSHHDQMKEQLTSVFNAYNAATLDHRRMYEEMKDRDAENLKVIEHQSGVIANLQVDIEKLQRVLSNTDLTPRTQKLQNLEKELSVDCWRQRKRQQNATKIDEMTMKSITLTGQKVVEHLEKLVRKGESILKLSNICYKLETEEERTIVGEKPSVFIEDEEELVDTELEAGENFMVDDPSLEVFWRRHCKVLLSRVALRMHQESLTGENNKMRNSLKHYLTGASLASSSQLMLSKQIRGRRIPVGTQD